VLQAMGSGANQDYPERERGGSLLELDASVHCDQNIKVAAHSV
jgi:hypothetical protein